MKFSFSLSLFCVSMVLAQSTFAAPTHTSSEAAQPTAAKSSKKTLSTMDVDYGEMYVIQKRSVHENKWLAGLGYTYGFSNPYVGIHGAELQFSRQLGDFLQIGINPSVFATSKKDVADKLTQDLSAQKISTKIYRPQYSTHLRLGVSPLGGMLSWLNSSTVQFDLIAGAGFGAIKYKEKSSLIPSIHLFLTPQVMLNANLGFTAGLQTSFERFSSSNWQNRVDTLVGVLTRF